MPELPFRRSKLSNLTLVCESMSAETRIIGSPDRDNRATDHPIYGQTPTIIDEYSVIKLVGQGSMGSVYEVQHNELGRHFALKLMAGTLAGNHEAIERFRAETKALGKLDHPNIVQAIDAGEWQGRLFLVTELLAGSDLASHINRSGKMEICEVIPIAIQLCEALSAAHAHGFFHRDIKPSNIFLLPSGIVKLLDFGLVRCESSASMTCAGSFMGTVDFVAPEQAGNPTIARACSDIYSLGCTLIYLLSGQPPFDDKGFPSIAAKIHAHLHDMPKWLQLNHAQSDRWFIDLLRDMVAKNPDSRPSCCSDIADCLRQNASRPKKTTTQSHGPFRAKSQSAWAVAGLATSAALAGLWWQQSKTTNQADLQQTQSNDLAQSATITATEESEQEDKLNGAKPSTPAASSTPKPSLDQTSTLPVSRTQSARGVPQFTKQSVDKDGSTKQRPNVLSNKYD